MPRCYGSPIMHRVAGVLLVLLSTATLVAAPTTHAAPDPTNDVRDPKYNEDEYTAFYTPPEPLPPGQPGDLIRTEPSRLVLEPSGQLGAVLATGTRIMYRSNDTRSDPMAVAGTYFEPFDDWPGRGPRPLIVYGPGTQGQGDQCAPSRQFNPGIHFAPYLDFSFNYEELFVATMVARGFAIVMTDYQGLGTPDLHTYVNQVAKGNAMLDAGRAAMRLPDTSLDPRGPIALWGYSQGGGRRQRQRSSRRPMLPNSRSWEPSWEPSRGNPPRNPPAAVTAGPSRRPRSRPPRWQFEWLLAQGWRSSARDLWRLVQPVKVADP